MELIIDLTNRWENDPIRAYGILVHSLDPDSPRIGISYPEDKEISTHWKDREMPDPVSDAKEWIGTFGAIVIGEVSIPSLCGKEGYLYLIVDQTSLDKVTEGLKQGKEA